MKPTRVRSGLPVGLLVCLVVSLAVLADTFTVAPPGTMPPPDFTTIQEAIDAAVDGDCITVEPGTYVENIDFLGKAITVQSADGPEVTIIDGNQDGSVVTFVNGEAPGSVLSGFTITNGSSSTGGGIYCLAASPTLENNTICGNSAATRGGGVYNRDGNLNLTNCVISENVAGSNGGGAMSYLGSLTVTDCTFVGNTANWGGGIQAALGGGPLTNCIIVDNDAGRAGGGVRSRDGGNVTLDNCLVQNNSSSQGGGVAVQANSVLTLMNTTISQNTAGTGGGVLSSNYGYLTMVNCVVAENYASGVGGAIGILHFNTLSSTTITNCTISGNVAGGGGGSLFLSAEYASSELRNSVLWQNSPNEIEIDPGTPLDVTYSDIEGGWPGSGNIDLDPLFVDSDGGDFHLLPCSPCIDVGDNTAPDLPATDFEGDPRIENGTVDMGVDEVLGGPGPCPEFIRGDCNNDGFADISDPIVLIDALFNVGAMPPCLDACDADDSGQVNLGDAVILLFELFFPESPFDDLFGACSIDPTADAVGCDSFVGCP